jgi:hypothetical protein
MVVVLLTIAFADSAPRTAEVVRWSREIVGPGGVDGIAHVTLRTVTELGALAIVFVNRRGAASAVPLRESLERLRGLAPECAVSAEAAGPTRPSARAPDTG